MNLRRVLGIGLAAVLAAGPALALPGPPALAATKPGYVAIVISGHGTHCVKWHSGITGDAVLNAVASVGYRSDGLIVQIDGSPSSGKADASHFWSYWHDTKGSWSYSNSGASGYAPAAGSVEGWSYDNGKSSPPEPSQSPSGLYATLCGAKDKKRVSVHVPATTAARASSPARTSTRQRTSTPSGRHASGSAVPITSSPSASVSGIASHAPVSPRGSRSPTTSADPTPASSTPTDTSAAAAPRTIDPSPAASSSSSSGSPVGLIVAAVLVVVLGAGAGGYALRRRNSGG